MDEINKQRHRHKIAESAAQEARTKHQAACNRVTGLATQLAQAQTAYESQVSGITRQLAEAERAREALRQELEVARESQASIAKTLTY